MKTREFLEMLSEEDQVAALRHFLRPTLSRIRPFLALFAIKNYLLREASFAERNEPTPRWYQDRLMKAGLKASASNVRDQLEKMADIGVVDRRRARGWAKTLECQYCLNETIYPALERALKQLLGVDMFNEMAGTDGNL